MKKLILNNLKLYFGDEFNDNEALLEVITDKVIANVKMYRRYPDSYTDEDINKDLARYQSKIEDVIIALFNRAGVEGQTMHQENNVNVSFVSEGRLYDFVTPLASVG